MTAASAIRFQALARKRDVFDTASEADRETLIDEVRCTKVVQFSKKGKCLVSKSVLQKRKKRKKKIADAGSLEALDLKRQTFDLRNRSLAEQTHNRDVAQTCQQTCI